MATILIAEDDPSVRASVERALKHEKHTIISTKDGAEALEMILEHKPDLILLDIMMPYMSGIAICKHLRERGNRTPILVITARHEVSDRVEGLDAGADDYMVKPFSVEEMFARIRALLRRTSVNAAAKDSGKDDMPPGPMEVADLVVDPSSREAKRGDTLLDLTKTEFDILELLVFNAGGVLSREDIYQKIWGYEFTTNSKSLDVHVGYLRRKMEADDMPRLLHTVRGVGYIVKEPEEK